MLIDDRTEQRAAARSIPNTPIDEAIGVTASAPKPAPRSSSAPRGKAPTFSSSPSSSPCALGAPRGSGPHPPGVAGDQIASNIGTSIPHWRPSWGRWGRRTHRSLWLFSMAAPNTRAGLPTPATRAPGLPARAPGLLRAPDGPLGASRSPPQAAPAAASGPAREPSAPHDPRRARAGELVERAWAPAWGRRPGLGRSSGKGRRGPCRLGGVGWGGWGKEGGMGELPCPPSCLPASGWLAKLADSPGPSGAHAASHTPLGPK